MADKFKKQDVFNPEKFTYLDQDEARILNEMTPLEYRKGEKIFNQVFHYTFMAVSLMFIILSLCYSFLSSKNFSTSDGYRGYGAVGLIFFILTCIAWIAFSFISMKYHNTYEKNADEKKQLINITSYFIFIPLILTTIFLVPLRESTINQYYIAHRNYGYRGWESYMLIAFVWAVAIILYILTIRAKSERAKKAIKITDFIALFVCFYIPLFFLPVLQTGYSVSYTGSYLMIFAPIIIDIGLIVGLFSNSTRGTHSAYHVILDCGVMMELLAIVFYAMNNVNNVAS